MDSCRVFQGYQPPKSPSRTATAPFMDFRRACSQTNPVKLAWNERKREDETWRFYSKQTSQGEEMPNNGNSVDHHTGDELFLLRQFLEIVWWNLQNMRCLKASHACRTVTALEERPQNFQRVLQHTNVCKKICIIPHVFKVTPLACWIRIKTDTTNSIPVFQSAKNIWNSPDISQSPSCRLFA